MKVHVVTHIHSGALYDQWVFDSAEKAIAKRDAEAQEMDYPSYAEMLMADDEYEDLQYWELEVL